MSRQIFREMRNAEPIFSTAFTVGTVILAITNLNVIKSLPWPLWIVFVIAMSVTVCTATFMTIQAIKFLGSKIKQQPAQDTSLVLNALTDLKRQLASITTQTRNPVSSDNAADKTELAAVKLTKSMLEGQVTNLEAANENLRSQMEKEINDCEIGINGCARCSWATVVVYARLRRSSLKPNNWRVKIQYFDIADSELEEKIGTIFFVSTSWKKEVVRSDAHVPRVRQGEPRIRISGTPGNDMEVVRTLIEIFTRFKLVDETIIVNSQSCLADAEYCIEILPRKSS